jgi:alanine racemase
MSSGVWDASVQGTIELSEMRATRAVVDLDAIAGNVRAVCHALPDGTRLMAIVKADGYGHGAAEVARAALDAGTSSLGVATVSEGASLRRQGIDAPILVLGSIDPGEVRLACQLGLEITIAETELLGAVQHVARGPGLGSRVGIHLKVDTGLRRYGAAPDLATALASRIAADPHLRWAGVCTHFASADEPEDSFTSDQLRLFERVLATITASGVSLPPVHAANSAGILTGRGTAFGIVRLGIALYGVPPSDAVSLLPGMRGALRVESRVARVFSIDPGDSVGYNRTFRATSRMRGALIPIGYADGYRRSLSGRSWVGVHGKSAPVLGRVSMDQIVVSVPDDVTVRVGDFVHVVSDDAEHGAPSVMDLARLMETNSYEVLVGLRGRIPRVFTRGGIPVAAQRTTETEFG